MTESIVVQRIVNGQPDVRYTETLNPGDSVELVTEEDEHEGPGVDEDGNLLVTTHVNHVLVWTSPEPTEEEVEAEEAGAPGPEGPEAAMSEVEDGDEAADDEDYGTGPYEGRTVAQLQAVLRKQGKPVSGTHDELVERARE